MAQKLKLKLPDHLTHDRQNFQKISQDGSTLERKIDFFFCYNDHTETKVNTAVQIQPTKVTQWVIRRYL